MRAGPSIFDPKPPTCPQRRKYIWVIISPVRVLCATDYIRFQRCSSSAPRSDECEYTLQIVLRDSHKPLWAFSTNPQQCDYFGEMSTKKRRKKRSGFSIPASSYLRFVGRNSLLLCRSFHREEKSWEFGFRLCAFFRCSFDICGIKLVCEYQTGQDLTVVKRLSLELCHRAYRLQVRQTVKRMADRRLQLSA